MERPVASIGPIFIAGEAYDAVVISSERLLEEEKCSKWRLATMLSRGERLLTLLKTQEPDILSVQKKIGIQLASFAGEVNSSFPERVTLLSCEKNMFFLYRCSYGMLHHERGSDDYAYPYVAFLRPRKKTVSAIKLSRF